jgi:hypothetical protein
MFHLLYVFYSHLSGAATAGSLGLAFMVRISSQVWDEKQHVYYWNDLLRHKQYNKRANLLGSTNLIFSVLLRFMHTE